MASEKVSAKGSGSLSSDKLIKIIECLAANRLPCRLLDLTKALNLPQSTILRYLKTLVEQNYAYQDKNTGCYALTWKICRLADAVKTDLVLRNMANPYLNKLANKLNAGVLLVAFYEDGSMYLDMVANFHSEMRTMLRIGKDAPLHCSASGKILLSTLTRSKLDLHVERSGLPVLTANTIKDRVTLDIELAMIREQGYALDNEECERGYRCVSVPLYDYTDQITAAVSVYDSVGKMTDERINEEILPYMFKVSKNISLMLGHENN